MSESSVSRPPNRKNRLQILDPETAAAAAVILAPGSMMSSSFVTSLTPHTHTQASDNKQILLLFDVCNYFLRIFAITQNCICSKVLYFLSWPHRRQHNPLQSCLNRGDSSIPCSTAVQSVLFLLLLVVLAAVAYFVFFSVTFKAVGRTHDSNLMPHTHDKRFRFIPTLETEGFFWGQPVNAVYPNNITHINTRRASLFGSEIG